METIPKNEESPARQPTNRLAYSIQEAADKRGKLKACPRDALYPESVDKLVDDMISQSGNEHRFVSGLFDRTRFAATRNP
jgi:hypothetical protein